MRLVEKTRCEIAQHPKALTTRSLRQLAQCTVYPRMLNQLIQQANVAINAKDQPPTAALGGNSIWAGFHQSIKTDLQFASRKNKESNRRWNHLFTVVQLIQLDIHSQYHQPSQATSVNRPLRSNYGRYRSQCSYYTPRKVSPSQVFGRSRAGSWKPEKVGGRRARSIGSTCHLRPKVQPLLPEL